MNNVVGYWIGVAIFAIAASFFGVTYYTNQDKYDLAKQELRDSPYQKYANDFNNKNVENLMIEVNKLSEAIPNDDGSGMMGIEALRQRIRELRDQTAATQADIETREGIRASTAAERKALNTDIAEKDAEGREVIEDFNAKRGQLDKPVMEELQKYLGEHSETMGRYKEAIKEKLSAEINEPFVIQDGFATIKTLLEENERLRDAIRVKVEAVRYQKSQKTEEYDGRIILADAPGRFVTVNLGRRDNVHRGMRFDVIRRRKNEWAYMGIIELTRVDASKSNAVILDGTQDRKICEQCGYVATDPEMQYCPYCSSGEDGDRIVRLIRTDLAEKEPMAELDPILEGDFITNPLYSPRKNLRFVITGEPVFYEPEVLAYQITENGGTVQETISENTDFLVLGRVPEINEETMGEEEIERIQSYQKALEIADQYGIPIMREIDLINFFRK